jgi:hypothetical protein
MPAPCIYQAERHARQHAVAMDELRAELAAEKEVLARERGEAQTAAFESAERVVEQVGANARPCNLMHMDCNPMHPICNCIYLCPRSRLTRGLRRRRCMSSTGCYCARCRASWRCSATASGRRWRRR